MAALLFQKAAKMKGFNCCWGGRSRNFRATNSRQLSQMEGPRRSIYEGPIVIGGISGRFPKSLTMEEFKLNLFNAVDMTTDEKRWKDERLPPRNGFLNCLDKFDALFFNQTPLQAEQMDPQTRLLLEATFEAIVDAGFSPTELRGSRTGVFSAALGGEALDYGTFNYESGLSGYIGLSAYNYMIPAKIAFNFDFQGASCLFSSACSSSFTALEAAVNGILLGKLDAAIVTGSNVCLNPRMHLGYEAAGSLSRVGQCKAFDESANGFTRAEAAIAILIQKESHARRSYFRILNIGSKTDGFKHEGLAYPSGEIQEKLTREMYEEMGIDPSTEVSYVEAHGTGTPAGDPMELGSIYRVFCKSPSGDGRSRNKPLLLGSVKSNTGHAESAAGMVSIAKAVASIQMGAIPPNLHFRQFKPEMEAIVSDGNLKVVTESTPFERGLIGINSFGIGGTNSHLILEPGGLSSAPTVPPHNDLPILFPFSGRTEEMVRQSLEQASVHVARPAYRFLLQKAFGRGIPGYSHRGYGLVKPGQEDLAPIFKAENCKNLNPPLWVIFPGMGSQWSGMGKDLMKIEPFAESVRRSSETLKNIGLDLNELLDERNDSIFKDIRARLPAFTQFQTEVG